MLFRPSANKFVWTFVVLAIVAGVFVLVRDSGDTEVFVGQTEERGETGRVFEGGEMVHPVSLQALSQKTYDGDNLTLGAELDENESYTRYFITYTGSGLSISGIMNVPKGLVPESGFPVLILNHGHIDTAIYTNGRGLKREQDYLARRGYVVIHPDYRNHAQSDKDPDTDVRFRLGYAEDVINLIYAVRASSLPYLDGERIGMLGHSMGGGVTLNVLVAQPDLVDAAVLFAPVSGDNRDNFDKWVSRRPETAQRIIDLYGSPDINPEFWDNISAINFLENITTPIMLHHGTADDSVPLEWSERLNGAMKQASKDMTFYVYEGEPHEFINAWPLVMRRTTEFFDFYLKPDA